MPRTRLCSALLLSGFAALLLAAGPVFADPTITNGSFELPAFDPNSLNEITTTGVPGWTGSTLNHEYVINGNVEDLYGNFYGVTPFGQQYLGLNGVANRSFHSIESQAVTGLTIGQTYALTIYIANLDGASGPKIQLTVEPNATGTGNAEYSAVFTAPDGGPYGDGVINFVPETLTFKATSNVIDLNINNLSFAVMGIDNVSIAAVPEPATWALVGAGALGWGLVTLRRCAARA